MSDTDRLAALLHDDFTLSGFWSCVHSPENEWAPWCDVLARRLIAAGVTLDPRPAPDAALREAAQEALTAADTVVENYIGGTPNTPLLRFSDIDTLDVTLAALRSALDATP